MQVTADYGSVSVWGSYSTQLPSADVHDLNHTATAATPAVLFSRDPRPLTLGLDSENAQGLLCNGNFTVRVHSQAAIRTGQSRSFFIYCIFFYRKGCCAKGNFTCSRTAIRTGQSCSFFIYCINFFFLSQGLLFKSELHRLVHSKAAIRTGQIIILFFYRYARTRMITYAR